MIEPLTEADCDLRDFSYMPLDVVRLRDSEGAVISSGDEFRAAVLLWCASWHQVPAASLPNDDRLLANLAGFGRDMKRWKAVREGALRGFIECSDGRLYHPVIAEKANEAAAKRRSQQKRTANATKARKKKDDERNGQRNDERNVHQGKGIEEKGIEEEKKENALRASDDFPKDAFDRFYGRYPHKVGRAAALKAFAGARKSGVPFARLMSGLDRYIASKPPDRAWCNPATWLNQHRWDDEPDNVLPLRTQKSGSPTAMELLKSGIFDEPTSEQDFDLDLRANPAH